MKKFTEKVNEAYQADIDRGEIAKEHAKELICNYIEGEIDGLTLHGAWDRMLEESLEGIDNDGSTEKYVVDSLLEFIEDLKVQALGISHRVRTTPREE